MSDIMIVPTAGTYRLIEYSPRGFLVKSISYPGLADARRALLDRLDNPTDAEIEEKLKHRREWLGR